MNARQARKLIKVEYWPNTNKWRILVAGTAVGYWPDKEDAESRARLAHIGLVEATEEQARKQVK